MKIPEIQTLVTKKNMWRLFLVGLLKKLVWVFLIYATSVFAQNENKHIRSGNDMFAEENYKDAEVDYMKALEKNPESVKGQYNLGDALYKLENYEDATKLFESAAGKELDDKTKAEVFYNLGNSYLKAQKLPEAIDSYKNSLRLNPDDMDAKYNLQYALNMQQQQQQQQDQQQDQENKEDKEDQEQEQKDQEQNQEQQQNQDQQEQEQQQQNQQQAQPQQISKQDAERMLEALKNDENKTLEKVRLQQVPAKAKKTEKDW